MSIRAKTIMVTGASRGLGLEFVRQILGQSTPPEVLIAACRSPSSSPELHRLADMNTSLRVIQLDVGKDEEIQSAAEKVKSIVGDKGLNLLINNAGIFANHIGMGLGRHSRENLQLHFNTNVSGPIILTQVFLPLLEQAASLDVSQPMGCDKASVVMLSSIRGSQDVTYTEGQGKALHYKCSKSALNMAMVVMSREVKSSGISVWSLHPGRVRTAMGAVDAPLSPEESVSACLKLIGASGEAHSGKMWNYDGSLLPY